jgi:hypothetical protein
MDFDGLVFIFVFVFCVSCGFLIVGRKGMTLDGSYWG